MREFTIGQNDAGQRLDRWLGKTLPVLPAPLAQKYIRIKRVKLNGKGAKRDTRLQKGDVLQLYINDEFFEKPTPENAFLSVFKPQLNIVYEDENLMLLDKRPGMVVHPDETERVNTLITHIQAYLYQKKEWSPYWENSFAPALCNRIDRNTGGIVIAAKNAETLRIMNQKIKDREVEKSYLCIVLGTPKPAEGRLENFLVKDEGKKQVFVHNKPVEGGRTAVTLYRTLAKRNGMSLVECHLITGRTHQIRAQMAAAGHPLLGDGKYGRERENKRMGKTNGQALYSYKLSFPFTTDAGCLEGLKGREWTVTDVPFVEEFFPGVTVD
ncbi:MAG: RluA family pseudouridine synthase [Ruminiclostridium sp.]|nr:RluA family pseudouridine synthase [Ruminiclostridium sp.]